MPPVLTIAGGAVSSLPPDVCKTPTPVGTVPTPYVNEAEPPLGDPPTEKVFVAGSPACTKSTKFMPTNGDQAGVGMGIVSAKIMGKAEFAMASLLVKMEGKPATYQGNPTTHNNNNTVGAVAMCGQFKVSVNG